MTPFSTIVKNWRRKIYWRRDGVSYVGYLFAIGSKRTTQHKDKINPDMVVDWIAATGSMSKPFIPLRYHFFKLS